VPEVCLRLEKSIPYYDAEGRPRGYRTHEAARRLLANEIVTAIYGRKGHIKAIFAKQADGACAVQEHLPSGTRYSFRQHLDSGHVTWAMKRLGKGDELRPIFLTVLTDCMVKHETTKT